jgi:hypothetical protein
MLGILIAAPWLALIPAACFLGLYRLRRRGLILATAITWAAYAAYEYGMHRRWLCSGECDIRIDLLLLYPLLLVLSLAALIAAIRSLSNRS